MSSELNSKIGAQSGSMDADARGPEPMAGDESEVPVTQVKEICPRGNNEVIIYFLIS